MAEARGLTLTAYAPHRSSTRQVGRPLRGAPRGSAWQAKARKQTRGKTRPAIQVVDSNHFRCSPTHGGRGQRRKGDGGAEHARVICLVGG